MIHFTAKNVVLNNGRVLVDFELDAFANLQIEVDLEFSADLEIVIGEVLGCGDSINREPGGFRKVLVLQKSLPCSSSKLKMLPDSTGSF